MLQNLLIIALIVVVVVGWLLIRRLRTVYAQEWVSRPEDPVCMAERFRREVDKATTRYWGEIRQAGRLRVYRSGRTSEELRVNLETELAERLQTLPADLEAVPDSQEVFQPETPHNGSYDGWIEVRIRTLTVA